VFPALTTAIRMAAFIILAAAAIPASLKTSVKGETAISLAEPVRSDGSVDLILILCMERLDFT
jgi:hypothetical protein